jgi:hypothetical protein
MLKNLSDENKSHLQHLLNTLLNNSYIPPQWKQSIIIPLLKPDKPTDDPSSYRPISLTSCLCKVMERILANRIQWLLESKKLINKQQAGFRRGCSTTDHIIQLESQIKQDFSKKRSTVAVFLDISKAYDSLWTQGLIYKASRLGISGPILAWLQEFLTGRSLCVRVGSHTSQSLKALCSVLPYSILCLRTSPKSPHRPRSGFTPTTSPSSPPANNHRTRKSPSNPP